jgi:tetratricopeptide (TPR) repeat protein
VWQSLICGSAYAIGSEIRKSDDTSRKPYSTETIQHYNRGVELHAQGQVDEAISEYKLATRADSRMEQAWSNLGSAYAQEKSYDQAIQAFQKALAICEEYGLETSGTSHCLVGLAEVYRALGKNDKAEPLYKRAVVIDEKIHSPLYAQTLDSYASLLRKTGRPAEATKLELRSEAIRAEQK